MVDVLGMESKRRDFAKNLSGGQKRKLSVGIAIIAGSKVRQLPGNVHIFDNYSLEVWH